MGKLKQLLGFVGEIQVKRSFVGEIETKTDFCGYLRVLYPLIPPKTEKTGL